MVLYSDGIIEHAETYSREMDPAILMTGSSLLALVIEGTIHLFQPPEIQARIQSFLETGRPLKN